LRSDVPIAFAPVPQFGIFNGATRFGLVSANQMGWIAGSGSSGRFTNNWFVKAEYPRFDAFSYTSPPIVPAVPLAPGYAWNTTITLREHVLRVGLNYKFD
jgi:opacity protein-like surface antigen